MQPRNVTGNFVRRPTQDISDLFKPGRGEEGVPMAPDVEIAFGPERLMKERAKKADKKSKPKR